MPIITILMTLLKVSILGGWIHLVLLLVHSLRRAGGAVYTVRLLAALMAAGVAVLTGVALVQRAALDGLLPESVGRWPGMLWLELPAVLLVIACTIRLVGLLSSGSYRVIDEALREIRRLRSEVGTDPLTGLWNRASLSRRLEDLAGAREPLTLIFIDVDDFKMYNDRFGHLAGDEVLRGMAVLFHQSVRRSDVVARYGGEEFVIVLPGARVEVGRSIAEKIRHRVGEHDFPHRRVTLSVGVATASSDATDPIVLLNRADEAMYRAKADGGNRVYDGSPRKAVAAESQEGESPI